MQIHENKEDSIVYSFHNSLFASITTFSSYAATMRYRFSIHPTHQSTKPLMPGKYKILLTLPSLGYIIITHCPTSSTLFKLYKNWHDKNWKYLVKILFQKSSSHLYVKGLKCATFLGYTKFLYEAKESFILPSVYFVQVSGIDSLSRAHNLVSHKGLLSNCYTDEHHDFF